MKKLIYFGMGLFLCLSAAVWTGCDKDKEKLNDTSQEIPEIALVYVEGGTFMMGEPEGQDIHYVGESPVHSVTLDGFYIGKYEVTQGQWETVMGTTVEEQRDKGVEIWASDEIAGVGNDYPMYFVTRQEAISFCEKLSQKTGKKYRLPTEAEWEYAARGGQKADGTKYAGSNDVDEVAWHWENCDNTTHPVGQKKPNGLGLYDMNGNVWEMCSDWYGEDYYSESPVINPQGPSRGDKMVIRGDSWFNDSSFRECVWSRGASEPDYRGSDVGFRVVCER